MLYLYPICSALAQRTWPVLHTATHNQFAVHLPGLHVHFMPYICTICSALKCWTWPVLCTATHTQPACCAATNCVCAVFMLCLCAICNALAHWTWPVLCTATHTTTWLCNYQVCTCSFMPYMDLICSGVAQNPRPVLNTATQRGCDKHLMPAVYCYKLLATARLTDMSHVLFCVLTQLTMAHRGFMHKQSTLPRVRVVCRDSLVRSCYGCLCKAIPSTSGCKLVSTLSVHVGGQNIDRTRLVGT